MLARPGVLFGVSVLMFACGSEHPAGAGSQTGGSSGSGGSGSSGSATAGSTASPDKLVDPRDGKSYGTKTFGAQRWMTENLAFGDSVKSTLFEEYPVTKRVCPQTYPDPSTPAPCDLYGGYYTWAASMALPKECNGQDCTSQVLTPHRGICPEGWHIPSTAEFETLGAFLAGETGLSAKNEKGLYTQLGAAMRLDSACSMPPATSATSVGFAGLPSGFANETGYVSANGSWTYWQAAKNDEGYSYGWGISCEDDEFGEGAYYKSNALPVRCVKD